MLSLDNNDLHRYKVLSCCYKVMLIRFKEEISRLNSKFNDERNELTRLNDEENKPLFNQIEEFKLQINKIKDKMKNAIKSDIKSETADIVETENTQGPVTACPECLTPYLPTSQIYQCNEGHVIGGCCRTRDDGFPRECKKCVVANGDSSYYLSRNKFMEQFIKILS